MTTPLFLSESIPLELRNILKSLEVGMPARFEQFEGTIEFVSEEYITLCVGTKPNPEGLLKIIKIYPYDKNKIFYLGDTIHDFIAAKKSKIKFLHCNWGFFMSDNKKIKRLKKITDISRTFS